MTWDYWICLYTQTHCVARGLRPLTIAAYKATLLQFRAYVEFAWRGRRRTRSRARDVLEYLEHLRRERNNGDSAVNRAGDDPEELLPGDGGDGSPGTVGQPDGAVPAAQGSFAQAAGGAVCRGGAEAAGGASGGHGPGAAGPGDPVLIIWHGDPGLGVRRVEGRGRGPGRADRSRARQGRPRAIGSAERSGWSRHFVCTARDAATTTRNGSIPRRHSSRAAVAAGAG